MSENAQLTNLELYKDNGGYFMRAEYLVETDTMIKQIRVPKIEFDVDTKYLEFIFEDGRTHIDLGMMGYCPVCLGRDKKTGKTVEIIEEIIEEKTKEMTIAEIEKKLGHKIKIVSEEKK